jgi:hypothetical protein
MPLAAAGFTEIIERDGRGGSAATSPARNDLPGAMGVGIVWKIRRIPG